MGMNIKAWQKPYNCGHEYLDGGISRVPRQFLDVGLTNTLLMSWMKSSSNAHDQRTPWHSDWQLNCQICLFYVY